MKTRIFLITGSCLLLCLPVARADAQGATATDDDRGIPARGYFEQVVWSPLAKASASI